MFTKLPDFIAPISNPVKESPARWLQADLPQSYCKRFATIILQEIMKTVEHIHELALGCPRWCPKVYMQWHPLHLICMLLYKASKCPAMELNIAKQGTGDTGSMLHALCSAQYWHYSGMSTWVGACGFRQQKTVQYAPLY